jgi:peptidoglycan/LPS O-acetylase OafA/YrhL
MLYVSIILFLYAVLSGFVMVVGIFRGAKPWVPLALGHGVLAATALVLALLVAISTGVAAIKYGVAVLFLTALGGLLLLSFHLRGKPHPWVVVLLHALAALGGVGCLVFALFH